MELGLVIGLTGLFLFGLWCWKVVPPAVPYRIIKKTYGDNRISYEVQEFHNTVHHKWTVISSSPNIELIQKQYDEFVGEYKRNTVTKQKVIK